MKEQQLLHQYTKKVQIPVQDRTFGGMNRGLLDAKGKRIDGNLKDLGDI